MAVTTTMKLLAEPNGADYSQRRTKLYGTATVSGSYVAGGFALPFTTISAFDGAKVLINTLTPTIPLYVEVWQQTPATSSPLWYGFQYNYATGLVQIFVTGTAAGLGASELAAGTLPTALTGAGSTLGFEIHWQAE